MAMRAGSRVAVGSAAWIAEERSAALQIAKSEIEEFSHSACNEVDWLNEHMAEIFSENQTRVTELFKTPGKLRGKTPRTAKKTNVGEGRVPLSDIFSATPHGALNPFSSKKLHLDHARSPQFKVAEDRPRAPEARQVSPANPKKPQEPAPTYLADSGYHGSQSHDMMDMDGPEGDVQQDTAVASPRQGVAIADFALTAPSRAESLEETFESAKEEQTRQVTYESTKDAGPFVSVHPGKEVQSQVLVAPEPACEPQPAPSPEKSLSAKSIPRKKLPAKATAGETADKSSDRALATGTTVDEARSPSDGSSPIRPIIRTSSLNFASLPAREPLTSNKSLGGRMSRTSHLEQNRISYYQPQTGGKSLGTNVRVDADHDDNDDKDEMDVDDDTVPFKDEPESRVAAHNKSYTQRLQDQISKLGQAQPGDHRLSKSIANLVPPQQISGTSLTSQQQASESKTAPTPKSKPSTTTPGAFPKDDDEDDEWIAPPGHVVQPSPRPVLAKSHSADVMEGLAGKHTIANFELPLARSRQGSPNKAGAVPDRTTSASAHSKSASVPSLPTTDHNGVEADGASLTKAISASNAPLTTVMEDGTQSPPKSPSRTFRDSPLKQVKNKLSSILKSSKGLLVSSAAISAEGKALISPSPNRLGLHAGPSVESFKTAENVLYPDLAQHGATESASPSRQASSRKTRASAERERREAKEMEREAKEKEKEAKEKEKEAKRMADQMGKLEKVREKEREKARVFSREQARLAEMERQVTAQKEKELAARAQARADSEAEARAEAQARAEGEADARTVPSSPAKSPTKATRTSPRKPKMQQETEAAPPSAKTQDDDDVDMTDASAAMPPPPVPRSATTTAPRGLPKRPVKPTKELPLKSKQAPTVIRVTPGSQHSQFHPSNSVLAATLQDTLPSSQSQPRKLVGKASHASMHTKPSMQSLSSSTTSTGKPRALELAAKRKEQEERAAQQKREAKLEMERKRAAMQEAERQREEERRQAAQAQVQAKKEAQRQAALEKAKQTRAPPPAARSHPNGPPDYSMSRDQAPSRPPSRLGSTMQQPVNTALSNTTAKKTSKRPLQQDANDESSRPAPSRPGATYQSKDAGKRIRMTDQFDDDIDMADSQPTIKGPPVRPSGGLKKDMPHKSGFGSSYTTIPQGTRDLFKTTVTAQHNSQKATNPIDMAQISKGAIPFASNPHQSGPSHKTPARPTASVLNARSAAKSSPRLVAPPTGGDAIELPEIQTDDEDEDEDEAQLGVAPWANSPDLARALMEQERVDPMQIFGPPAPIDMEEVFSKSKNRFHKFRARTSSANWSGADRLTEDDVRKDLRARDKMRREGGWSYDISKEMN